MNKDNSQENIRNELEFRVWFRDEFGMDYLDAVKWLDDRRKETARSWHQTLTSNKLI